MVRSWQLTERAASAERVRKLTPTGVGAAFRASQSSNGHREREGFLYGHDAKPGFRIISSADKSVRGEKTMANVYVEARPNLHIDIGMGMAVARQEASKTQGVGRVVGTNQ
jgi:hypothetical protein